MKVQITEDIPTEKWDSYVYQHEHGEIFHLSVWKEILQESFGYEPNYIFVTNESNEIEGILPLMWIRSWLTGTRLVSLPFSYICGPLTNSKEGKLNLANTAMKLTKERKCDYLEIKMLEEGRFEEADFIESDYYNTYILDLQRDEEEIWKGLYKKSIQWAVKKAVREKVSVQSPNFKEGIVSFYQLKLMTLKKHGIPPPPFVFFKLMGDLLEPLGCVKLFLATIHNRPVAGDLFFVFKRKVYYMYGASDSRYLKYRPNQLLLWEAIKWAKREGFKLLDFGRVSKTDVGLAQYKRHWGTEEKKLHYYYWPKVKGIEATNREGLKYKIATKCWRLLPTKLASKGALLYKHLG